QPGANVITVTATDAGAAQGTAVITVTMNRPPVVSNPGIQGSLRGLAVELTVEASDLDGNSLTWSASGLPTGLAIDPSTGIVSGVPVNLGVFYTDITASDGLSSGEASFSWWVNPVPVTPIVGAADKTYDGTTETLLTSCTLAGVLPGD